MKNTTSALAGAFAAVSLSAAALTGAAANASTAPAKAPDAVGSVPMAHAVSAQEKTRAASYWTPERMKSATDGEALAKQASKTAPYGPLTSAQKAPDAPTSRVAGKAPNAAAQQQAKAAYRAASESPVRHIGKVFFTQGGKNYVCSANSVSSENGNTVSTAGHCVHYLKQGGFATNFVFVPAYENGNAPYGKWVARGLYASSTWTQTNDINADTAFVVVDQQRGRNLGDVVGQSGLTFNEPRGQVYKSFGYPAAPPFNGETLKSCTGSAKDDTINRSSRSQGIPCDMTGGSSGGPWFLGADVNGYQNSVNSYGYPGENVMYGPYWDSATEDVWNSAQTA